MKVILAAGVALATMLASPAFAAPRHRAVAPDAMAPYGQSMSSRSYARQFDVVTLAGRVVGEDPDANIRTQLLHDPVPSEY